MDGPHHPLRKFLKDSYTYYLSLNITLYKKFHFQSVYRIGIEFLFLLFFMALIISLVYQFLVVALLFKFWPAVELVSSVCVFLASKKKNHASIISTCAMKYRPLLHHLKSLAKAEFAIIGN